MFWRLDVYMSTEWNEWHLKSIESLWIFFMCLVKETKAEPRASEDLHFREDDVCCLFIFILLFPHNPFCTTIVISLKKEISHRDWLPYRERNTRLNSRVNLTVLKPLEQSHTLQKIFTFVKMTYAGAKRNIKKKQKIKRPLIIGVQLLGVSSVPLT